MKITGKQAHVLQHLDRVIPLSYKVEVKAPARRYQLDGWECTSQITGLVVKGLVQERGLALEKRAGHFTISRPPADGCDRRHIAFPQPAA